jgi:hypothetical protein
MRDPSSEGAGNLCTVLPIKAEAFTEGYQDCLGSGITRKKHMDRELFICHRFAYTLFTSSKRQAIPFKRDVESEQKAVGSRHQALNKRTTRKRKRFPWGSSGTITSRLITQLVVIGCFRIFYVRKLTRPGDVSSF